MSNWSRKGAIASALLLSAFALSACQQGGGAGGVNLGLGGNTSAQTAAAPEGAVLESELRAFCPPVTLREGTAYFRTYAKGAEGDDDSVIYQASIADVTRSCRYEGDNIIMTVAVAGKIVPGPKGRAGTINMPIRVASLQGQSVLDSNLYRHQVAISDTAGATQFVFTDSNVVVPKSAGQAARVLVGYDEGPYDTP